MTCPRCNDERVVEREMPATPEEVDEGWELGIVFIPCPACSPNRSAGG